MLFCIIIRHPLHRKTSQKSLERGFGGRTFPQKGFPLIITHDRSMSIMQMGTYFPYKANILISEELLVR